MYESTKKNKQKTTKKKKQPKNIKKNLLHRTFLTICILTVCKH